MSKQIYVDANGNETEYGGTVNYGSILPMSPTDDTPVSETIEALKTVSVITPTRNTTNISSSGYAVSCLKYGRVVVLSVVFTTARAINSDDIILSDLPIPQFDTIRVGLFDSTNAKPIRFKVNTSGELSLHYDSMASGLSAYGEIVYISAS